LESRYIPLAYAIIIIAVIATIMIAKAAAKIKK
jgi:hypothetical protein